MTMNMKIAVFWDVVPCSVVNIVRCFGETQFWLESLMEIGIDGRIILN
jgi:hypothetical protein